MDCSVIGSFQKYYPEVVKAIEIFRRSGIDVLSPSKSEIVNEINGFVILGTDISDNPIRIESATLNKILESHFVYVVNPDGYVGRTVCYEIGRINEKGIPVFYKNKPIDLPIDVPKHMIIPEKRLARHIGKNQTLPLEYCSHDKNKHSRMEVAYVCGPYIGQDYFEIDRNIVAARDIAFELWKKGYAVVCPHMNSAHFETVYHLLGMENSDFMKAGLELVRRSDILVLVDGWERSEEAKEDIEFAKELGLTIYEIVEDVPNKRTF